MAMDKRMVVASVVAEPLSGGATTAPASTLSQFDFKSILDAFHRVYGSPISKAARVYA
jgi:hypothetical protein